MPEGRRFKAGVSGNPSGRKALPEELKAMRDASLSKAIEIMHAKVHDENYVENLKPHELTGLLEVVFDRCGLPKVLQADVEHKGADLVQLIRESLADARAAGIIPPPAPEPAPKPEYQS